MYLIVIAWIYVVLMMAVAEATNANGTVLGAIVTFVLYGIGPAALVAYLMSAPARNKRNKKQREEAELAFAQHAESAQSAEPDAGSHAPGGSEAIAEAVAGDTGATISPVRKIP